LWETRANKIDMQKLKRVEAVFNSYTTRPNYVYWSVKHGNRPVLLSEREQAHPGYIFVYECRYYGEDEFGRGHITWLYKNNVACGAYSHGFVKWLPLQQTVALVPFDVTIDYFYIAELV